MMEVVRTVIKGSQKIWATRNKVLEMWCFGVFFVCFSFLVAFSKHCVSCNT